MATISSVGVGTNGLDVKNIISSLVDLEKKPLDTLKVNAAITEAKISAFGQIKSLVSTLNEAAGRLTSVTGWNAVTASSSNEKSVSVSAIGGTQPTSFDVVINKLAKGHNTASGPITPLGTAVGGGTLKLWAGAAAPAPANTPSIDIAISASDTVSDIASKINGANAGVTATVLSDASGQRLLLSSKTTGTESAFHMTVEDNDGDHTDASGLSRLLVGSSITQAAADAEATVNGIAVTSASNSFKDTVAGVTFTALEVSTGPVKVSVARDNTTVQSNLKTFVEAYNAVNDVLNEATKYDAANKKAGMLQGDSTTIGLQNSLRNAVQSITTGSKVFTRLSDIGLAIQRGGNLSIDDSTKLSKALDENIEEVKNMFRTQGTGTAGGVAVQIKALTTNLLANDGFFKSKDSSLQMALKQNAKEQARVNDKVDAFEKRITRQYNALDSKMGTLNALNAYVTQQVAAWNKSTG